VKASSRCQKKSNNDLIQESVRGPQPSGRKLFLPALVALGGGCGLLAGPVSALELGEIQVRSALGQPLRASVAYALQPNEQIHDYCIYLRPGTGASGLPGISNAAITVTEGTIGITGRAAIREPLLFVQLTVDCPTSAHLRRDYSVFIDPGVPSRVQASAPAAESRRASSEPAATPQRAAASPRPAATPPQRAAAPTRPAARPPIASSATYRVQPGDSLSVIASRISGRSVGIWQAVDELFAANTDAFINNDRNLVRAGAVLIIPDSILSPEGAGTVQATTVATQAEIAPAGGQAGPSFDASNDAASTSASTSAATETAGAVASSAGPGAEEQATARGQETTPATGDVDPESPFVSPAGAEAVVEASEFSAPAEVIPPTVIENAAATRTAPAVRTPSAGSSGTWAIWLGGSGIGLILALLLFGRRLKERFLPSYGGAATIGRRRTDGTHGIEDTDASSVPGLPAQGTAAVARVVSLDADLEDGSGLQFGEMDVAQNFGFSDSGEFGHPLDLDLGSAGAGDSDRSTGAIAPQRFAEGSIIVSETPPQHEDPGEYGSTAVGAMKEIAGDSEDTAKDLRAVEEDAEEEPDTIAEEYNVIGDIDYSILEQDYEDEFTATQALSAELSRAARELSKQFGKDEMGDTLSDTTINEALEESPDDKTTVLPSSGDALSGDDETTALPAVGKAPRARDDTSHLAISSNMTLDDTANEEISLDVFAADNDATVEVDVETATIDTKKIQAS
jgi:LysM repeat protein